MTRWRFLQTGAAPGAVNMATDQVLLEESGAQPFRPFFRLYTWSPSCLSLGRFQNPSTGLRRGALEHVEVVRRSTGGGAIWHAEELTYSLGFRAADFETSGVKATYERICGFLLETWRDLGLEAAFAKDVATLDAGLGVVTPACFAGTEAYDILVAGRKLGGNAQRRERGLVFQHGSIPLRLDWAALERLFAPGFLPDSDRVTDLASLGFAGSPELLGDRLAANLERCLGIGLEPGDLTTDEVLSVDEWVRNRYSNAQWTQEGTGNLRA